MCMCMYMYVTGRSADTYFYNLLVSSRRNSWHGESILSDRFSISCSFLDFRLAETKQACTKCWFLRGRSHFQVSIGCWSVHRLLKCQWVIEVSIGSWRVNRWLKCQSVGEVSIGCRSVNRWLKCQSVVEVSIGGWSANRLLACQYVFEMSIWGRDFQKAIGSRCVRR